MPKLSENRRARFDYDILENIEAGIVLSGQEVKAAKMGQMSLAGAHVAWHRGAPYLINAHISPYKFAGPLPAYDPTQSRQLLLSKQEIKYLRGKMEEKGLTIIPLKVYTSGRYVKVEIALARGRKQYDKREAIKKRDTEREIRRMKS